MSPLLLTCLCPLSLLISWLSLTAFDPAFAGLKATTESKMVPHKLLLRLLSDPYRAGGAVTVLPKQLPPHLPTALPLPTQAHVLVSLVRGQRAYDILLDVAQPQQSVSTFFLNRLRAQGWRLRQRDEESDPADGHWKQPGFAPPLVPTLASATQSFCQETPKLALELITQATSETTTAVRLRLDVNPEEAACTGSKEGVLNWLPMPVLLTPPATQIHQKGGGGSSASFASRATFITKLSGPALATAYAEQMQQAGWTRRSGGSKSPLLWSVWTLKDSQGDQWSGLLYFAQTTTHTDHYAGSFSVMNASDIAAFLPQPVLAAQGDPEADLPEAFVLRLLAGASSALPAKLHISVGQMPEHPSLKLPLPGDAAVLGSLVNEQQSFKVFLDVSQSPAQIRTFYERQLLSKGWQKADLLGRLDQVGFVTSGFTAFLPIVFCHKAQAAELILTLQPTADIQVTNVQLSVKSEASNSLCRTLAEPDEVRTQPKADALLARMPIPTLSMPPKTLVFQGGSGLHGDEYDSSAVIETRLSRQDLVRHYQQQMQQFGWHSYAQDETEDSISLWQIEDQQNQPWFGVLSLLRFDDGSHRYYVTLRVAQP